MNSKGKVDTRSYTYLSPSYLVNFPHLLHSGPAFVLGWLGMLLEMPDAVASNAPDPNHYIYEPHPPPTLRSLACPISTPTPVFHLFLCWSTPSAAVDIVNEQAVLIGQPIFPSHHDHGFWISALYLAHDSQVHHRLHLSLRPLSCPLGPEMRVRSDSGFSAYGGHTMEKCFEGATEVVTATIVGRRQSVGDRRRRLLATTTHQRKPWSAGGYFHFNISHGPHHQKSEPTSEAVAATNQTTADSPANATAADNGFDFHLALSTEKSAVRTTCCYTHCFELPTPSHWPALPSTVFHAGSACAALLSGAIAIPHERRNVRARTMIRRMGIVVGWRPSSLSSASNDNTRGQGVVFPHKPWATGRYPSLGFTDRDREAWNKDTMKAHCSATNEPAGGSGRRSRNFIHSLFTPIHIPVIKKSPPLKGSLGRFESSEGEFFAVIFRMLTTKDSPTICARRPAFLPCSRRAIFMFSGPALRFLRLVCEAHNCAPRASPKYNNGRSYDLAYILLQFRQPHRHARCPRRAILQLVRIWA
ncbi:hypothetical protein BDZ89DRAFT_1031976 [Hymenopellis radicata]|nr:hypothetical protein BDZ89DRAFT_1031976 [Hymenopellis radicata]